MLDITTIILTYNEERHIRRCLENVCPFSKQVIVVDSPSTDQTVDICKEYQNVDVVVHPYPGNQAEQLNWALNNIHIDTEWVLRIDADEYLSLKLVEEIKRKVPKLEPDINGIYLQRQHIFMGKRMRFEKNAVILRLFRYGKAKCEVRLMDEYMLVDGGRTVTFDNLFFDHNLCTLSDYCKKHINYAPREAAIVLDEKYNISKHDTPDTNKMGKGGSSIRKAKNGYQRLPLFWRGTAYFFYRYFLTGTFLQGKAGFVYCFIQAWWYRTLVDGVLVEVQDACGDNVNLIKNYMFDNYKIRL